MIPGTALRTAVGGGGTFGRRPAAEQGRMTATVYGLIRDGKYTDAIGMLAITLQSFPRSRAALSLIAYCYFYSQDFLSASQAYEQLVRLCPGVDSYKLNYAHSLYKAGLYADASRVAQMVEDASLSHHVAMLQAAIRYEEEDLSACRALVERGVRDDPETLVNEGCILFKEGRFEDALGKFEGAVEVLGPQADVAYNVALCQFRLGSHGPALSTIADIIERGVREHPELSVGSNTDGIETRSVGNTQTLRETALVEAFNLKAAIEYTLGNEEAAREALSDMPPREEYELDSVTLHNQALMHIDSDPTSGFRKLSFLVHNPPFPPEAFPNLLLLYIKHEYLDLAADVLAEMAGMAESFLDADTLEFVRAMVILQSSAPEAFRRLDTLSARHIEALRSYTRQIQEARIQRNSEEVKAALKRYDEALEQYIPVLMAMARIYWDRENYPAVERIFRQSVDFCPEHDTWNLNVAHVFFMQGDKYREAARYYKPIVEAHRDSILDVTAIVLANLCVSYIMTSQNDEAEKIMQRIEAAEKEREEEEEGSGKPGKGSFHLCIVNLVIGTLYCTKGNFEFGISRVITSLRPLSKKLGIDTWFYAKRALLALAEHLAKHMLVISDASFDMILEFLTEADEAGKTVSTVPASEESLDPETHNVSFEARLIKRVFLRLREFS